MSFKVDIVKRFFNEYYICHQVSAFLCFSKQMYDMAKKCPLLE